MGGDEGRSDAASCRWSRCRWIVVRRRRGAREHTDARVGRTLLAGSRAVGRGSRRAVGSGHTRCRWTSRSARSSHVSSGLIRAAALRGFTVHENRAAVDRLPAGHRTDTPTIWGSRVRSTRKVVFGGSLLPLERRAPPGPVEPLPRAESARAEGPRTSLTATRPRRFGATEKQRATRPGRRARRVRRAASRARRLDDQTVNAPRRRVTTTVVRSESRVDARSKLQLTESGPASTAAT